MEVWCVSIMAPAGDIKLILATKYDAARDELAKWVRAKRDFMAKNMPVTNATAWLREDPPADRDAMVEQFFTNTFFKYQVWQQAVL